METILVVSSALLWLMLLCNLFLTLALIRRVNEHLSTHTEIKTEFGLEIGKPAPDFTSETLSNETVHLSTYLGRKIAFIFISTTCSPCRQKMPELLTLAPKAAQAGVEFVLVSAGEAQETRSFVEEFDIHIPILVAPRLHSSFLNDYKAIAVPFYCIINEMGIVQASGHLGDKEWKTLVEAWTGHQKISFSKERSLYMHP